MSIDDFDVPGLGVNREDRSTVTAPASANHLRRVAAFGVSTAWTLHPEAL